MKINGKRIAAGIIGELKKLPLPSKKLVVFLVGKSHSSLSFVNAKRQTAKELGINFEVRKGSISDQRLLEEEIMKAGREEDVGGIIVQLPLPIGFVRGGVLGKLNPRKDVDNLTGRAPVPAPVAAAVEDVLTAVGFCLVGKTVAVVGAKGFLVGRPICRWLKKKKSSGSKLRIKQIDVETSDLAGALKKADLVISGVGKKGLIDPRWLKEGAGVIDFGCPPDLDSSKFKIQSSKLGFYTPTPGGTGPILVAELFRNFYRMTS